MPMINGMRRGWTFTFLSLFLVATSPMLWVMYFRGMGWREQRRVREENAMERKKWKEAGSVEDAAVGGKGEKVLKTSGPVPATNQEERQ